MNLFDYKKVPDRQELQKKSQKKLREILKKVRNIEMCENVEREKAREGQKKVNRVCVLSNKECVTCLAFMSQFLQYYVKF